MIGRNEGARLGECLQSLQPHSSHIIYADSASDDESVALARGLGVEVVALSDSVQLSAAAGRVAGFSQLMAKFSDVEFVQFIDGDCLLHPNWLAAAVQFLNTHPRAAVVCGRRYEAHPSASIYNAICDVEWDTPVGQADACGGDALFRVSAYFEVGGFNEKLLAGEEPELCGRLGAKGWEVWRIDALMTEHDARMLHFVQWWRRSRRGGFGFAQVWDESRRSGRPLYGRQIVSALAWVVAIPAVIIASTILLKQPLAVLALPLIYCAQILRIAKKMRADRPRRLEQSMYTLLAKVPESLGAMSYFLGMKRPTAVRSAA